jgi:hypothetical protein
VHRALDFGVPRKKKPAVEELPAEKRFKQDLLERGEAAKSKDGKLPPGATHEIIEKSGGQVEIVRRRFSLT